MRLMNDGFALISRALTPEGKAYVESFGETRVAGIGIGGNLLRLTDDRHLGGEVYETELSLLRAILSKPVVAIASAYFERFVGVRDIVLPCMNLLLRAFGPGVPEERYVPFHQDAMGLPVDFHMVNCWTMLYPEACGGEGPAPGLDFIPGKYAGRLSLQAGSTSKLYAGFETDLELIEQQKRIFGVVTPRIELGDILMFNEHAMHRTSRTGGSERRMSAEIRLVAANECAAEHEAASGHAYAHISMERREMRWPWRWQLRDRKIYPLEWKVAPLA